MRFLKVGCNQEFSLTTDFQTAPGPYAVLSHTWGPDDEEVTLKDVERNENRSKAGWAKLYFCRNQAIKDNIQYIWIDTCCIDQSNSVEVSTAITSMFRWYKESARCWVYLSDVSTNVDEKWHQEFRESWWHTRGWTLQELLAPSSVEFFTINGDRLGDKRALESLLVEITGIPARALRGTRLRSFGVHERLQWSEKRSTKRPEDKAYCLLGVFGVFMLAMYGEGEQHALRRLKREIEMGPDRTSQDHMHALWTCDYAQRLKRVSRATPGTCQWFLNHPLFLDWESHRHGGIMWYSASPGAGKSVLCRRVVEHFQSLTKVNTLHYFFDECDKETSTVEAALQALLHQLCLEEDELQGRTGDYFRKHGKLAAKRFSSLKKLFGKCLALSEAHETICVLDGLDQCSNLQDFSGFCEMLEELIELAAKDGKTLRILISSRPYWTYIPHVRALEQVRSLLHVREEDEASNIAADIQVFMTEWLGGLATRLLLSEEEVSLLKQRLFYTDHHNFLCVALFLDYLCLDPPSTLESMMDRLTHIPSRLADFWERALDRCTDPSRARVVFAVILAARHTLDISQLFAVLEQDQSLSSQRFTTARIKESIRQTCGLLVKVVDDKVLLVHNSLRRFLLRPDLSDKSIKRSRWQTSIGMKEGEIVLASACIRCHRLANISMPGSWAPFWPYARKYGTYHVARALRMSQEHTWQPLERVFGLGLDPTMVDENKRSLLHHIIDGHQPDTNLIRRLISYGGLMQQPDSDNMTCLHYATVWQHLQVMQILIENGVNINATVRRKSTYEIGPAVRDATKLKEGLTALHTAALFGRDQAVRLLLESGADAGACDRFGAIPLHLNLSRRLDDQNFHDAWTIDQRMPEHIWDFDDQIENDIVLRRAADSRAAISECLSRASGVTSEYADAAGRTALHHVDYLLYGSAIETVRLLLDRGHRATAQDVQGTTPVHLAAQAGDTCSLRALAKNPKALTIQDCSGLNALHHAVRHGNLEATAFILFTGRDLSIQRTTDNLDQNALHHTRSSSSMAELLLRFDVDATHRNSQGRDPLAHSLAERDILGVELTFIQVLLKHGANPKHLDNDGKNLAHLYVKSSCDFELDGLLMLEAAGVDPSEEDIHGCTILHTAGATGSLTVELLTHATQCTHISLERLDKFGKCFLDYVTEGQAKKKPYGLGRADRWNDAERAWKAYCAQSPPLPCKCRQGREVS